MSCLDIYSWLEQYSGTVNGFDEIGDYISGDFPFGEPFLWYVNIALILERMGDLLGIVDEYARYIPDDLPSKDMMKKMITADAMTIVINSVNHVKKALNIDIEEFSSYNDLEQQVYCLYELLIMLIENDVNKIYKDSMFEKLDDKFGNMLTDKFEICRRDVSTMSMNIVSIKENYDMMHSEMEFE